MLTHIAARSGRSAATKRCRTETRYPFTFGAAGKRASRDLTFRRECICLGRLMHVLMNFPAVNNSASRSCALSRWSPGLCCSMDRPALWIRNRR